MTPPVTQQPASGAARLAPDEIELYRGLYRTMLRIRGFEDRVQSLFLRGEVYGTTHLYQGMEAVATGVASALGPDDRVAATYRGHGHALALGVSTHELLAEMLGRATGINGGRSGSMNVTSLRHRLLGSYGIVGGSIAAATGAALALRRTGNIAVAYFGEGATNQGYFSECLNFAYSLTLPILFVCENNLYGEYTLTSDVSGGDIPQRACSLGVEPETIDGMAVWAVREAAERAVKAVRGGAGPRLIEARTYRFVGHSRSDPGRYRPAGELDEWKLRDPLVLCRARLLEAGVEALDELEAEVAAEIDAAERDGLAAPWPSPGSLPAEFAEPGV